MLYLCNVYNTLVIIMLNTVIKFKKFNLEGKICIYKQTELAKHGTFCFAYVNCNKINDLISS